MTVTNTERKVVAPGAESARMKSVAVSAGLLVVAFLGGLLGAASTQAGPSRERLIEDFYRLENAVLVSPHGLRKKIQERASDFVLVDLRSAEEYEREHIVGAVSIPAYSDRDTAYGEVDRIVSAFEKLPKNKNAIVYCYSTACMTGRKVGLILAEHGIYVQHLGIGWNEWRHSWTSWNHEHEWGVTKAKDYMSRGKEPGTFAGTSSPPPCTEAQSGCGS